LATEKLTAASQQIASHFLLRQGIFQQKQHECHPHPPKLSQFPPLKMKLKIRYFDRTEMMEAESRAVLNTLTEHSFQDVVEKWQKRWERRMRVEGDNFEGDSGQRAQSRRQHQSRELWITVISRLDYDCFLLNPCLLGINQ
jgi:hypothetical protein